jgi:hypothetical protein
MIPPMQLLRFKMKKFWLGEFVINNVGYFSLKLIFQELRNFKLKTVLTLIKLKKTDTKSRYSKKCV